jgi:hypothetical protein
MLVKAIRQARETHGPKFPCDQRRDATARVLARLLREKGGRFGGCSPVLRETRHEELPEEHRPCLVGHAFGLNLRFVHSRGHHLSAHVHMAYSTSIFLLHSGLMSSPGAHTHT